MNNNEKPEKNKTPRQVTASHVKLLSKNEGKNLVTLDREKTKEELYAIAAILIKSA